MNGVPVMVMTLVDDPLEVPPVHLSEPLEADDE